MNLGMRMRRATAALLTTAMLGALSAVPITARADDARDKAVAKGKEKKPDTIPIKIVDPIIVPDKGKTKSGK